MADLPKMSGLHPKADIDDFTTVIAGNADAVRTLQDGKHHFVFTSVPVMRTSTFSFRMRRNDISKPFSVKVRR